MGHARRPRWPSPRYCAIKEAMLHYLHRELSRPADLVLNALDDLRARDESGLHLTVTGLSAEMGDDGQVGRGNRVNGLITPGRPMSLEAAAGKNPTSHVGKIYNVLADSIARAVCAEVEQVEEANVQLLSTIGQPLDQPRMAVVEVVAGDGFRPAAKHRVASIADARIGSLDALIERLVQGQVNVY
jgi:S-adenosylmethionine synthetase